MAHADRIEQDAPPVATALSLAALVLLGTRFVQGFIFWGGASRRLIYDFHDVAGVDHAVKLDFDLPGYVAAKLTHALPGALWVQRPLEWTLSHHDLIVTSVWLWTFAELAVGLGLMFGLATRLAAFVSIWLNVALMLIFGWMGSTCLDEWTMAVSGVAMSTAVFLAGGGPTRSTIASVSKRMPRVSVLVPWIFSGPLLPIPRKLGSARPGLRGLYRPQLSYPVRRGRLAAALAHELPSPQHRPIGAERGRGRQRHLRRLCRCRPRHRRRLHHRRHAARRLGAELARWDGAALAALSPVAIRNAYPYVWASHFKPESIGFSGQTGARATITLPPAAMQAAEGEAHILVLEAIDGSVWRSRSRREIERLGCRERATITYAGLERRA